MYIAIVGEIFAQYDCLHAPNSIQCVNDEDWEERRAVLHRTIKGQVLGSFFPKIYCVARKLRDRWSVHPRETPISVMPDLQEMNLMAILTSCFTADIDDETLKKLAEAYHYCKKETEVRILGDPDPDSKQELDFQANLKILKDYVLWMMEDHCNSPSDAELPCMDALLHSGFPKEQVHTARSNPGHSIACSSVQYTILPLNFHSTESKLLQLDSIGLLFT